MSTTRTPPTVETEWTAHGLDCIVIRQRMGHPCGYVRVPEDHPWHGLAYNDDAPGPPADVGGRNADEVGMAGLVAVLCDDLDGYAQKIEGQVEVHGGITFSGKLHRPDRDGWWFGFDCAHSGDWSSWDDSGRQWSVVDMVRETERMAEQIASATAGQEQER